MTGGEEVAKGDFVHIFHPLRGWVAQALGGSSLTRTAQAYAAPRQVQQCEVDALCGGHATIRGSLIDEARSPSFRSNLRAARPWAVPMPPELMGPQPCAMVSRCPLALSRSHVSEDDGGTRSARTGDTAHPVHRPAASNWHRLGAVRRRP